MSAVNEIFVNTLNKKMSKKQVKIIFEKINKKKSN